LIAEPANAIVVSAASVWEITIKHALNRGRPTDMPVSGPQALSFFRAAGYELLAIGAEHAAAVQFLPDLHRDPFDRLIVAQALHEPLRLMTHDAQVSAYSGTIMLV
jgi:PIN domain nuclease of toxin-antitoxin system